MPNDTAATITNHNNSFGDAMTRGWGEKEEDKRIGKIFTRRFGVGIDLLIRTVLWLFISTFNCDQSNQSFADVASMQRHFAACSWPNPSFHLRTCVCGRKQQNSQPPHYLLKPLGFVLQVVLGGFRLVFDRETFCL